MTTWIIGDVHGCADELAALLERLAPGPGDDLLSCGDLLHRGPDPLGVIELLEAHRVRFVLGNHELAVLERLGRAPGEPAGPRSIPAGIGAGELLRGDGGQPLCGVNDETQRVISFLEGHAGFSIKGPSATRDGRPWWLVHAGVRPGVRLDEQQPEDLVRLRRTTGPGRPYWYEAWNGPELVIFGHTHSKVPRIRRRGGRPMAIGIDTGCVYGGRLTAYSPELHEFCQVAASRCYYGVGGAVVG
jgi:predicted phosphodiesterase